MKFAFAIPEKIWEEKIVETDEKDKKQPAG